MSAVGPAIVEPAAVEPARREWALPISGSNPIVLVAWALFLLAGGIALHATRRLGRRKQS